MKSTLCLLIVLLFANPNSPSEKGVDLLANGLKGWNVAKSGAWKVDDGVLHPSDKPGGYIWTEKSYENFELTLDYKTSEKCNSGVFFRTDPALASRTSWVAGGVLPRASVDQARSLQNSVVPKDTIE